MRKEIVDVSSAGFKVSPIASQCVRLGNQVYPAGQVPVDPKTGSVVGDDIRSHTRQCFGESKVNTDNRRHFSRKCFEGQRLPSQHG